MSKKLSLFILGILFFSCTQKEQNAKAFYYWKTNYELNNFEKDFLQKNNYKKIYIRCFDVDFVGYDVKPVGILQWKQEPIKNIEYIPVVFIKNSVFEHRDTVFIKKLSENVFKLVNTCFNHKQLNYNEIQIDCDWTQITKDKYFYFLKQLKEKQKNLSATLRLHQLKYRISSGIPPVDYCTLMCYNMGNLKDEKAKNSIFNLDDLKAYTNNSKPYDVPLNVAFPIFEWNLVYNNNNFKGILYTAPKFENINWKKANEIKYICTSSYFDSVCNYYFTENETIRVEKIDPKSLKTAIEHINQKNINSKNEIIYFDLDSTKIQNILN